MVWLISDAVTEILTSQTSKKLGVEESGIKLYCSTIKANPKETIFGSNLLGWWRNWDSTSTVILIKNKYKQFYSKSGENTKRG